MIEVSLKQIQKWISCDIDEAYLEHQIKGVTIDSRHVEKEMLFVPFKGENVDGHRFVEQALKDGAGASFYEKGQHGDRQGVRSPWKIRRRRLPRRQTEFQVDARYAADDRAGRFLRLHPGTGEKAEIPGGADRPAGGKDPHEPQQGPAAADDVPPGSDRVQGGRVRPRGQTFGGDRQGGEYPGRGRAGPADALATVPVTDGR